MNVNMNMVEIEDEFSHFPAATHNSCSFIAVTRKHQIQHLFAHVYVLRYFVA